MSCPPRTPIYPLRAPPKSRTVSIIEQWTTYPLTYYQLTSRAAPEAQPLAVTLVPPFFPIVAPSSPESSYWAMALVLVIVILVVALLLLFSHSRRLSRAEANLRVSRDRATLDLQMNIH